MRIVDILMFYNFHCFPYLKGFLFGERHIFLKESIQWQAVGLTSLKIVLKRKWT